MSSLGLLFNLSDFWKALVGKELEHPLTHKKEELTILMALYFYGFVQNICLLKEKTRYPREITRAQMEVYSCLHDPIQSHFFSRNLNRLFRNF